MTSLVWPESSIVKPTTCRIPQHCLKVWRCEVYLCSRHSTVPHVNQYLLAMELGLWNSLELDDLTLTVNDYGTCPIQKSLYSSKKKWLPTQSGDLHGDSQAKAAFFSDVLAQHGDFQTTMSSGAQKHRTFRTSTGEEPQCWSPGLWVGEQWKDMWL